MKDSLEKLLCEVTGAKKVYPPEEIYDLWSGYGKIKRLKLDGCALTSVVVKHAHIPKKDSHPLGWDSDISRQRKWKSYQVEYQWYKKWAKSCTAQCRIPKCYSLEFSEKEFIFVLEDLKISGYENKKNSASNSQIKTCLKWLAHFHALFIGEKPEGLWKIGTYWHLDTRPDEYAALTDKKLKAAAKAIDEKLQACTYQTFVHGDAKLANFCFSKDDQKVAAVDFQYVGGGCGIKDVVYFLSSCLEESECEKLEEELLEYYFFNLCEALEEAQSNVDLERLCSEWRALYKFAWADFYRFLKGWSPQHWKLNSYSERITESAIVALLNN